jgi:ubiquinone/menaquinone biosynthesis C-methylase UbiE
MAGRDKYIISGGQEGKKRLDVLGEILNPHTKKLLEIDGSIKGKNFLDLGCGGGSVTLMVAEMTGPEGNVTAIDFDSDILELAKKDAKEKGLNNISFRSLDAYELDHENTFDIAYSRFLLSHLQQPAIVLNRLHRSVKPGAKIIIEDIDFSGHFSHPRCEAFELYQHYFVTAAKNNGHNANIGLSLFEMFQSEQIQDVKFDVIQPCFTEGKGKWMAYYTFDKIKETLMRQLLLDENESKRILNELKDFTEDISSIISLPRIFRVWGVKGTRINKFHL